MLNDLMANVLSISFPALTEVDIYLPLTMALIVKSILEWNIIEFVEYQNNSGICLEYIFLGLI